MTEADEQSDAVAVTELETVIDTLVVVDNVVVDDTLVVVDSVVDELRVGLLDDVLLVLPPTPLNKSASAHKIKGETRIVMVQLSLTKTLNTSKQQQVQVL